MFGRIKNRRHSSTRMPSRNRNSVGRKVRVEKLDERKLMAADFGGFGDFYGPHQPDSALAIFASAVAGNNASANGATQVTEQRVGNTVKIVGTEFDDDVVIDSDSGLLRMTAVTTDDVGNQKTVQRYYTPGVSVISFDAGDGDDKFLNRTLTRSQVEGGDGNDVLEGVGPNTLSGGDGDDRLRGHSRQDYLFGGDGQDTLFGGGGNDLLNGGEGNDRLYGGRGHDDLFGGSGIDRMYGSVGNDELYGGDQRDYMYGGTGNDEMYGQSGPDEMYGGDGNDTMFGGQDNDKMRGQDGHDVMMGQGGRDTMWGGIGDDRLDGGASNDLLLGEAGRDMLFGRGGQDGLYGGENNDHLDGGDDGIRDWLQGDGGRDVFIRHVHIWSANDPDNFVDNTSIDEVFRDYGFVDVDGDFPTPKV